MVFCKFCRVVCFEIAFSVWVIQYCENGAAALLCERKENNGCCDGYFFSFAIANCTKCMPGYVGPNCTIPCPYPTYGELCQEYCNCSNSTCDVSTGCRTPTSDCASGDSGSNCTKPCNSTTDGDACQEHCNCSNIECTASTGCTTLSTDNKTSFPVTIEHKGSGRNVTLYSTATPDATNSTINGILIILIRVFGGVDILLICVHSVLFVIDHRRKNASRRQNTTGRRFVTRNNSMYENIEIGLSNY